MLLMSFFCLCSVFHPYSRLPQILNFFCCCKYYYYHRLRRLAWTCGWSRWVDHPVLWRLKQENRCCEAFQIFDLKFLSHSSAKNFQVIATTLPWSFKRVLLWRPSFILRHQTLFRVTLVTKVAASGRGNYFSCNEIFRLNSGYGEKSLRQGMGKKYSAFTSPYL